MALTAEEKQLCADWLTEPARKWQVLNRSQWKYQFREKTLVRFVEEATMDESLVPLLLEYLTSDDCKSIIQLYGQAVSSEWAPTRAWYEISNKAVGNLKAVRLYHALSIEPENGEDGPYLIEDGCVYRVSWTYYWKRKSVPPAPASTSGVSYRVVNVQADPDTGLFNYAIEKRERVQQDIEEYLMRSTAFEDVSEEVHMGVRGDPSLGGKPASVANGKTVTRKVTKNADCTHDVHNTTTQDKAAPGAVVTTEVGVRGTTVTTENRNMPAPASTEGLAPGESVRNQQTDSKLWNQTIRRFVRNVLVWLRGTCRKTIFDHSHSETTNVKDDPGFSHVEEAGNGVIHELTVQKTAEGYDVTESTTEEKSVPEASESIHVELDGTVRTVVHRNQPNKAPAPTTVGSSVTNERTHGGRWNQTIRNFVKVTLLKVGAACSKTIFSHRHSSTTLQGSDPGFTHVEEAGGGVIRSKTVTQTEKGFRVEESKTEEKPVSEASERIEVGLEGTVRVVTNRNQQGKAPAPTAVGESVENTRTDGGLWNQVTRSLVKNAFLKIGEACRKTIFEHRHSKTTVQSDDPGFSHAEEAGNGKVVSKSVTRTSTGAFRVEENETEEKPVSDSTVIKEKTLRGIREHVEKRNQVSPLPDPTRIGERVTNKKTDGGRYNTSKDSFNAEAAGEMSADASENRHTRTTTTTENKQGYVKPSVSFVPGKIVHKNAVRREDGDTSDVTERTQECKPSQETKEWEDDYGVYERCVYRNQNAPIIPKRKGDYIKIDCHFTINDFDRYDGSYTISNTSKSKGRGGSSADLKFTRHGQNVQAYQSRVKGPKRIWQVRPVSLQLVVHYRDAVTDYYSDLVSQNPNRSTNGVVAVRRAGSFGKDSDGNPVAIWITVEMKSVGNWTNYDSTQHGFLPTTRDVESVVKTMLGSL